MEKPGPLVGNAGDVNSLLIYPVRSLAQLWGFTGLGKQTEENGVCPAG